MAIPDSAVYAYQDIDLRGVSVRLCTVHWLDSEAEHQRSLLALLGMQTGAALPDGVTMTIRVLDQAQATVTTEFDDPFLYAKVNGNPDYPMVILLVPPDGPDWVSLPFVYSVSERDRRAAGEGNPLPPSLPRDWDSESDSDPW